MDDPIQRDMKVYAFASMDKIPAGSIFLKTTQAVSTEWDCDGKPHAIECTEVWYHFLVPPSFKNTDRF